MKVTLQALTFFCTILVFSQCTKPTEDNPTGKYTNGVFVVEEGAFQSGTGTVSFRENNTKTLHHNIYEEMNAGNSLGNILQSMTYSNNEYFLVVNNANKMHVVNAQNFTAKSVISTLNLPRYYQPITVNKGYISEWGSNAGSLAVYNPSTNTIEKRINVGLGAEKMVMANNTVYATCSGGLGQDSTIAIIDANTDMVIKKLVVGPNPTDIITDSYNNIWVLCRGQWNSTFTALSKPGKLVKINALTNNIDKEFNFTSTSSQPSLLTTNLSKTIFYYAFNNGVYKIDYTTTTLPTSPIISGSIYGLAVDPNTNNIYVADPKDYASNGQAKIYTKDGTFIESFETGILPNNFIFSNY